MTTLTLGHHVLSNSTWARRKDPVVLARASQPHPTEPNSAWVRRKRLAVTYSWLHGRPTRVLSRDI
jgi:uncharacterized protein (UPF0303 family)